MSKSNLEVFAGTLLEMARKDSDIIVVTSDSRGSGKLNSFGQMLPKQLVEVGIAEQNLVGIACGLASTGKKVYAVAPASFLSSRALEQIKNDTCYSNYPVKLIGISAGVSYGALGSTHHSLHDIAALRAINNISIIIPADNFETRAAIKFSAGFTTPLYIRFGKRVLEDIHPPGSQWDFGKAAIMGDGNDVAFIATGETVIPALNAAQRLEEEMNIKCRVISMHTVKPLDEKAIKKASKACRALITVEEHSIYGGLGEACAGYLMQQSIHIPFKIIAIPDEYTVTGKQDEIFNHYGISADGLAAAAKQLLNQ
jgi:transketolase